MESTTIVPETTRRMRYADDMEAMFDQITTLTPQQRIFVKERYRFLLSEYRRRCFLYSLLFYILRTTMTVGSLAVPALLSIQSTGNPNNNMYWITWSISLAVTTANGLTTLFKLDKRFFLLHGVAERLRTEAWQYLTLSGRYSGHHGVPEGEHATHPNQYVYYCSQVEKIRMKHIDDEFIRQADVLSGQQPTTSNSNSSTTGATLAGRSYGEENPRRALLTSVLVPTPLDPAHIRDRQRQSVASVESNETTIEMETPNGEAVRAPPPSPATSEERVRNAGGNHTVQVPEQRRNSLQTESDEEQPVLSRTRTMRRIRSVRVRATVSPRQIQPEQGDSRST